MSSATLDQMCANASGQSVVTNLSLPPNATAATCFPTQCTPRLSIPASIKITSGRPATRSIANELSAQLCARFESPASEIIDILSRTGTTSDANDNNIAPRRPLTRSVANASRDNALGRPVTTSVANATTNSAKGIKPTFDSGLWEPDDPHFGAYEEDLDCNEPDHCIDDIYDDEEARVFNVKDVVYETRLDPDVPLKEEDPFDFVYNDLPTTHHVLRKVPYCEFCGAVKFPGEGEAFCCRKGKVNIFIPKVPKRLRELFTSQTDKTALYFRKNIRYFNSHFSFTSFGASIYRRLATAAGTGVYTFKVHGQIYHKLDALVPGAKGPRHMQLYFYDTDETLGHRTTRTLVLIKGLILFLSIAY